MEDLHGRIILKFTFEEIECGDVVDWIDVTGDRDKWRAVVNAAVNLRVPKMREISSLAEEL